MELHVELIVETFPLLYLFQVDFSYQMLSTSKHKLNLHHVQIELMHHLQIELTIKTFLPYGYFKFGFFITFVIQVKYKLNLHHLTLYIVFSFLWQRFSDFLNS